MKRLKIGVMLLAFLLAAIIMVPMVNADNSLNNQTITIPKFTQSLNSTSVSFDYARFSRNLTREEFISNNKEYIDFLAQKIGRDAAIKMENDDYTKLITMDTAKKNALHSLATVSPTIQQVWGADIYLWPYESQIQSITDPNANPMTFVVIGNTKSQLKNYLWNHNWGSAPGEAEYGLAGSSTSSLSWDYVGNEDGLQRGNPLTYRFHLLVHSGGYSQIIGKYWAYGECHYEYSDSPGHHTILNGGFDSGETQVLTTLSSSYGGSYTTYTNSLNNAMSPWWSGSGHIFYI